MQNVLVTGGCGFIGSHVTDCLIERGYDVTVLDNLSQGRREWVHPKAQFVEGDVRHLDTVKYLMAGKSAVFHLAAMSRVLPSITGGVASALHSADVNIMGTLNVLVAASERRAKVIYSASSTVYGNTPAPHIESGDIDLQTPYAVSKYTGEMYCNQFAKMYGLKTVCLRYFQVYGPRQPTEGEYAMVTGIFIHQMKAGKPLTIMGGKQRRDFVHVKDIAKANVLAFEKELAGTLNIGTGHSHSIQELADLISPNQIHLEPRSYDMKETKAQTDKCKHMLGWLPEIGFIEGTKALLS